MKAFVLDKTFVFDSPDWEKTTQTQWIFSSSVDQEFSTEGMKLPANSHILYQVSRYDTQTNKLENEYCWGI